MVCGKRWADDGCDMRAGVLEGRRHFLRYLQQLLCFVTFLPFMRRLFEFCNGKMNERKRKSGTGA